MQLRIRDSPTLVDIRCGIHACVIVLCYLHTASGDDHAFSQIVRRLIPGQSAQCSGTILEGDILTHVDDQEVQVRMDSGRHIVLAPCVEPCSALSLCTACKGQSPDAGAQQLI